MSGIEGLDTFLGKLDDLRDTQLIRAGLMAVGVDLVGRVSPYPPAPAGSRYMRGGPRSEGLGRRWTVAQLADGTVVIGNNASYARWVHDRDWQTAAHTRTGWHTVQTEWEHALPDYRQLLAAYYRQAFES